MRRALCLVLALLALLPFGGMANAEAEITGRMALDYAENFSVDYYGRTGRSGNPAANPDPGGESLSRQLLRARSVSANGGAGRGALYLHRA